MKITEILAESTSRKIPFQVEYEYEWDDPNRDENLDPFETITFEGYVIVMPNMYGVRGSPTGYEVVITQVTDSSGNPFDQSNLNDWIIQRIQQAAIDQVDGD